jgi:hypothetical protein
MSVTYFKDLVQGSDEWRAARCGLLTASEMQHIISPAKLKAADNDKSRSHLYELLAQRITGYVEPSYISDDMLRGKDDECDAIRYYQEHYGYVETVGFITNDKWGFTLGYSPDALVNDGTIEVKGRRQKYQVESILAGTMPAEFNLQVQTGLMVSERKWCDFVSFCGGIHMMTVRIEADKEVQDAILEAAITFHARLAVLMREYESRLKDPAMRLVPTERRVQEEITI